MIVRELVTLMGYQVDRQSEKRAQGSVDNLKRGLQAVSAFIATGIIAQGLRRVITLGSDAAETMNVVTTSFEDQTDAVLEWASVQSRELGRSEFALREYAATLGAVLRPMTGSAEAAAQMSTDLAQLTVDLGSFFNAAEPDVLIALRAGITGESEPLKRFGIVMNVAALEAFRMAEGIRTSVKDMTEAQKVALRHRFIMDATAQAQGDAARTAGGFANLSKALMAVVTDLGTEIGMLLLPATEGVLTTLVELVRTIKGPVLSVFSTLGTAIRVTIRTLNDMLEAITGVEDALKIYAAVAITAWAVSTAPILVTIALIAAIGFAIAAVIEDLEAMGEGGESVIGGLISEFQHWLDETGSVFEAIGGIISTAVDFWAKKLFGIVGIGEQVTLAFQAAAAAGRDLLSIARQGAEIAIGAGIPLAGIAQAGARVGAGASTVIINNQTETVVNAPSGMNPQQLATETSTRVGRTQDSLMRRTQSQIAVGGG
jgi:hypothetical protein